LYEPLTRISKSTAGRAFAFCNGAFVYRLDGQSARSTRGAHFLLAKPIGESGRFLAHHNTMTWSEIVMIIGLSVALAAIGAAFFTLGIQAFEAVLGV